MKLIPELKQLRKEKRHLIFLYNQEVKEVNELTERLIRVRKRYFTIFYLKDLFLKILTAREYKIITDRFGLEDGRPKTLEEVGQEFGVTRDRVRQIEAKALDKIRITINNIKI